MIPVGDDLLCNLQDYSLTECSENFVKVTIQIKSWEKAIEMG